MKTKLKEVPVVLDKPNVKLVYAANRKQSERTLGCYKYMQLEWRFDNDRI